MREADADPAGAYPERPGSADADPEHSGAEPVEADPEQARAAEAGAGEAGAAEDRRLS